MSGHTPVNGDWLEAERDMHRWRRELRRLKRRARSRVIRTIVLTCAVTAVAVWMVARRVPLADSRILIRVTESNLNENSSPIVTGDFAKYLQDSAFTNQNLAHVIREHDLYPLARARGEDVAIQTLRDHIELEVFKNYLLTHRGYNEPIRTARIAIHFRDRDPEVSFAIARELADLVISSENQRRAAASSDVVGVAQQAVDQVADALDKRQHQLEQAQQDLDQARKRGKKDRVAQLEVERSRLQEEIKDQTARLRAAKKTAEEAELQHAMDVSDIGLVFDIVDERPPVPPEKGKGARLAMIGLTCFLILLPMCAIGVGAFDSRVHDREDVQRLGLPVVGHVPGFPGSDRGSFRARLAAERRRARRAVP